MSLMDWPELSGNQKDVYWHDTAAAAALFWEHGVKMY